MSAYTETLLRRALIDLHQFWRDNDTQSVADCLRGTASPVEIDRVQQLVQEDDPLIREYAENIWQGGWRLNQAFISSPDDTKDFTDRTLYVKGDDGKTYVVVADI